MDNYLWVSDHGHGGKKNYVRRWEIWNEFSDITTNIGKALLSGGVWVAISHTIVSRGKHNGDATSTCHSQFQQIV